MIHVIAPEITPDLNSLGAEVSIQHPLGLNPFLLPGSLADTEDILSAVVQGDVGMVRRHSSDEIHGRIVVESAVHPSAEEISGVIDAGEGDHALEEIRTAQAHDGGVGCSHAAARGDGAPVGMVFSVNEGKHFFNNIVIIALLIPGSPGLVAGFIGPAVLIHRVDAENLNSASIDIIGQGVNHAEVFIVAALAVLGLKYQERISAVTVYQNMHVPVQAVAEPACLSSVHLIVLSVKLFPLL